jgi:hypothetical protein
MSIILQTAHNIDKQAVYRHVFTIYIYNVYPTRHETQTKWCHKDIDGHRASTGMGTSLALCLARELDAQG